MPARAATKANAELSKPDDAVVVDLRTPAEFAQGHPKGAVSLPFSEKGLAERLAVVLDPGAEIRLLASQPRMASAAARHLRGGYRLAGTLDSNWLQSGLPVQALPDISVQGLAEALPRGDLTILDVREPLEWETGHAPGAILISLGSLREQLRSIPDHAPVAVICEAGVRSSSGASLLQAAGFTNVMTVSEGMSGYRRAGLAMGYPDRTDHVS